MKIYNLLIAAIFCMLTLISCATQQPGIHQNLLEESWMRSINLNASLWTQGADRWFFTGEPNATEQDTGRASTDNAISLMTVKVAQFTNVSVHGCFQVQIAGQQDRDSVIIFGPNASMRQILVQVSGDTVMLTQAQDAKGQMANLKNVIVRIGVKNLRHLKVTGSANVEGRMVTSNGLTIYANNSGNVLLAGQINLVSVSNDGPGTVSVMGAYTPCLDIISRGSGTVNVCGRVGIQTISNLGNGKVNIIGADSRSLAISACNSSVTTVAGYVNLRKLNIADNACVNMYWVCSDNLQVTMSGGRAGLAGTVNHLELYAMGNARFGGQYLHANSINVQTHNNAHANISAKYKIFASAANNSSIYFFGSPNAVSRFTNDHGVVLNVWGSTNLPVPTYRPQFMTSVNPASRSLLP